MNEPEDDTHTRTGVLRAHFGEYYRFWIWVRNQFTPISMSVIVSVIVTAGGYIAHLRENISSVTTRVVVLETRVIPVIDQSNKTAALEVEINGLGKRVDKLEDRWENARVVAGTPNETLLHPRRKR